MSLSRRGFLGTLGLMTAACQRQHVEQRKLVIDLSHPLGPGSPYIKVPGTTFPFRRAPIATIPTRGVYANRWELTEHIGTHIDAPCHFAEEAPCL